MADFYTTNKEEALIHNILKDGLKAEIPKYYVLRIALARSLGLDKYPLNHSIWNEKTLGGETKGEYHLKQITGKDTKEDFDTMLRALLYTQHKEELDESGKNILNDEGFYKDTLSKYIKRGLYEIRQTWKLSDCFYQWCLDNLHLQMPESAREIQSKQSEPIDYAERIKEHCKKNAIEIDIMNKEESYRCYLMRVEVEDSMKIELFKKVSKQFKDVLGNEVLTQSCKGIPKTFDIQIAKAQKYWQKPKKAEIQAGLESLKKADFKLGLFAGVDNEKKPFCFDLVEAVHLFVAGATGGGKTALLKTLLVCLLRHENVQITIIDPKGSSFKEFQHYERIKFIVDSKDFMPCVDELVQEMEERYKRHGEGVSYESMPYHILLIDELDSLASKGIDEELARLAQKAREARIHLILGTQSPTAQNFTSNLRANIPSRIALKTSSTRQSMVILDEIGAEKLTGKGDMLIKLPHNAEIKRVLGVEIENEDINNFINT